MPYQLGDTPTRSNFEALKLRAVGAKINNSSIILAAWRAAPNRQQPAKTIPTACLEVHEIHTLREWILQNPKPYPPLPKPTT